MARFDIEKTEQLTMNGLKDFQRAIMERWTGAGIFVLLLCMGVSMILYARKLKRTSVQKG